MAVQEQLLAWIQAHYLLTAGLIVVALLLLPGLYLRLKPFAVHTTVEPNPARSFEEATARIVALQAAEAARDDLIPVCHTRLMSHDQKTESVVVLLHGFTSCPEQFAALGQALFNRGHNVYIPRTPHHGLADQMTMALQDLTAEVGIVFASDTVDIAQGLGEKVILCGLSGGGTYATWLAQERDDIDLVAPIAPFLGVHFIPAFLNRPLTNLFLLLPNRFLWWDPRLKADNPYSAPYSYRRYATHALANLLRLGFATKRLARRRRPRSAKIIMITNARDESVSNKIIGEFVETWQLNGAVSLDSYQFAEELRLPHDLITPTRPGNNISAVYPVLIELLEGSL